MAVLGFVFPWTGFPDWWLQHRRRAERALVMVGRAYLLGVLTRRVEKLVEQLVVTSLSKSQVSEMTTHLDGQVEAFRNRPLDAAHYTFVWMTALVVRVREYGRTVNVHALGAVGVNADSGREVLGLDVRSDEDGAGWLAFLRSLTAQGLSGVKLAVSDARRGLVNAIVATLPSPAGNAGARTICATSRRRSRRTAQPWVATLVRTIFDQPDPESVRAQYQVPRAATRLAGTKHRAVYARGLHGPRTSGTPCGVG
ncbi:transposase [Dactylosporangium sp. CS-047395]|uniref:transposase n=1 Tax=Dactylosporangium sp. CS-047395 TaxID=3239936 RepID=UPI003D9357C5